MRSLIFGGTGFCGSHLAEACLEAGERVFVTGRERGHKLSELSAAVTFIPVEVTRVEDVERALEQSRPDRIYHLAGLASVARSFGEQEQLYKVNVFGTLHILEAVRKICPEARLLVVGSAEEYGPLTLDQLPICESSPLNPVSPYGVSRVASTLMSRREALGDEGLHVIATRTFNLVGPRQSRRFVCSDFAAQIAEGCLSGIDELVIRTGNLEVKRDFSSVVDGVKAYRALLEKGQPGEIYNICSGQAIAIKELLEKLSRIAGLKVRSEIDPARLRKVELQEIRGDPSKLVETTGLRPGGLDQILEDLYHSWHQRLKLKSH